MDFDAIADLNVAAYAEFSLKLQAGAWEVMQKNLRKVAERAETAEFLVCRAGGAVVGSVAYCPAGKSELMQSAQHIYRGLGFVQEAELPMRLGVRYFRFVLPLQRFEKSRCSMRSVSSGLMGTRWCTDSREQCFFVAMLSAAGYGERYPMKRQQLGGEVYFCD